ncbi:alpha/beta fold hydrolase [Streptomyces chartreusis]|uniref:alpha/beta fold hydrolase n=1 Tax=Streptomyces chartreusis TaxID=1969 RepID=UPI0033DEB7B8
MDLRTTPPAASAAPRRTAALTELVEAIRQLEGLTRQIGPVSLPSYTCDRAPELVSAVCRELDVPLTFDAPAGGRERDHAVAALVTEIHRAQSAPELADLSPRDVPDLAAEARLFRDEEDAGYRLHAVHRPDGTVITAVETGPADAPCILLSPACAMSHRLSLPWLRALRTSYRCVVLQTRGTGEHIEDPEDFDRRGYGVPEQAGDLTALIETLATGPVHLMGLCGGAVPALVAAAQHPDHVGSLSLWHADLELGRDAEKTEHQVNLRALLDLAGESRATASWMRDKLTSGPMTGVPAGIGPLVVRPYATPELFYRYAKLTGATMHWDSRPTAAEVAQPCLVVTSRDDNTAHPAGSRRLAEILSDARLEVAGHGTHLDAFDATPEQVSCLLSFLDSLPART